MRDERETKSRLLASAKREFMEKGYMQASLRSICKDAGLTTGALYFFFQDKEDLFASLVEEPLMKLYTIMTEHYGEELQETEHGITDKVDFTEDLAAARQIIHYLYQYQEEFQLILTKSQGSRFEQYLDQFVEATERQYRILADRTAKQAGTEKIDDYMLHWISHMHIDLFIHMLTHEESEEMAQKHIEQIIRYLICGWQSMFR